MPHVSIKKRPAFSVQKGDELEFNLLHPNETKQIVPQCKTKLLWLYNIAFGEKSASDSKTKYFIFRLFWKAAA